MCAFGSIVVYKGLQAIEDSIFMDEHLPVCGRNMPHYLALKSILYHVENWKGDCSLAMQKILRIAQIKSF